MDGSWGRVPLGCSAQTGGDRTAHYKTSGDTGPGCIHDMYQLICTSAKQVKVEGEGIYCPNLLTFQIIF